MFLSSFFLCFLFCWKQVDAHASDMVNGYCSLSMTVGTKIMGKACVSSSSRSVVVKRGSTSLSSGDSYVYGETLTVSLSSTSGEYVIQTTNAPITSGGCSQTRKANSAATITAPSSGTSDISIWAGWTSSENIATAISSTFVLKAPGSSSPTRAPSLSPTRVPTETPTRIPTNSPTFKPTGPTYSPTIEPTFSPSYSLSPTCLPTTHFPTSIPSSSPTSVKTSNVDSTSNGLLLSDKSNPFKVIVGIIIGIGSLVFLLAWAYLVANNRIKEKENIESNVNKPSNFFSFYISCLSVSMGILAIVLSSVWSANGGRGAPDSHYLGKPIWISNPKAWHAILMTAGFYVSQLFALTVWNFLPTHYAAKLSHVFWQLCGLSTMIAGYWAILKYKYDAQSPNFSTIHSWIGIGAISLYGVAFLWGSVMAILTRFFPSCIFRKAFDLRAFHKDLGMMVLWLVNVSILTGIMSYLPNGSCYYGLDQNENYTKDTDAAEHFGAMPDGCKIGNGLGIVVIVGTMLIYLAVSYRIAVFRPPTSLPPQVPVSPPVTSLELKVVSSAPYEEIPVAANI